MGDEGALRDYVVFGFSSTHDALAAETALKTEGVAFRVVPTPQGMGELCGIALRVLPEDEEAAKAAMDAHGVSWTATVTVEDRA